MNTRAVVTPNRKCERWSDFWKGTKRKVGPRRVLHAKYELLHPSRGGPYQLLPVAHIFYPQITTRWFMLNHVKRRICRYGLSYLKFLSTIFEILFSRKRLYPCLIFNYPVIWSRLVLYLLFLNRYLCVPIFMKKVLFIFRQRNF